MWTNAKVEQQWPGQYVCTGSDGRRLASGHTQGGCVHMDVTRRPLLDHAEAQALSRFYAALAKDLEDQMAGKSSRGPETDGPTGGTPVAATG